MFRGDYSERPQYADGQERYYQNRHADGAESGRIGLFRREYYGKYNPGRRFDREKTPGAAEKIN